MKSDTRWWDFPICRACERWIEVQQAATTLEDVFWGLVSFGVLGVLVGLFMFGEPTGIALILLGLVLAAGSPFVYLTWTTKQEEADRILPSEECQVKPVKYHGWSGTIHTFSFSNRDFCQQFRQANASKVFD